MTWHSGGRLRSLTYGNNKPLMRSLTSNGNWDYVLVGTTSSHPLHIIYGSVDRLRRPLSVTYEGTGFEDRTETYEYDGRGRLVRAVVPGLDLGFGAKNSVRYRFTAPPDHVHGYTIDDRTQRNWYNSSEVVTRNEALVSGLVSNPSASVELAADGSQYAGVALDNDQTVWLKGPGVAGSTCYGYDPAGSLSWEATTNSDGKTVASVACPEPPASGYAHFWCYDYDDWGRLASMSELSNLQQGCTPPNKLVRWRFGYDWKGRRSWKLSGATLSNGTDYYHDTGDAMISEVGVTQNQGGGVVEHVDKYYYYLAGELLGREDFQGTKAKQYLFHNDFLGTPHRMTNATGTVVWGARYEPFGDVQLYEPPSGTTNNWRFPGQYDDRIKNPTGGRGPYYNYHRYYDPAIGRYTQVDPLIEHGSTREKPYAYAANNPLIFMDPEGLWYAEPSCKGLPTKEQAYAAADELINPYLRRCVYVQIDTAYIRCGGFWAWWDCGSKTLGKASSIGNLKTIGGSVTWCNPSKDQCGPRPCGPQLLVHEFAHRCGWLHGQPANVPGSYGYYPGCK